MVSLEVRWPARMQHLTDGPLSRLLVPGSELWLDGGHNPAGGQAIAQTLADMEERSPKPVGLVLGMMGNKDALHFLAAFQRPCTAHRHRADLRRPRRRMIQPSSPPLPTGRLRRRRRLPTWKAPSATCRRPRADPCAS